MGYTHYWGFKKSPKQIENGMDMFAQAVKMFKKGIKIIEKEFVPEDEESQFKLCGFCGTGKPVLTDTLVNFNGDEKTGNACESCTIAVDDCGFTFCKTCRLPYDVAVCLALLCFKKVFGDNFWYKSDGDIRSGEEGWKLAKKVIRELTKA